MKNLYYDAKTKLYNVKTTVKTLLAGDFPITSGERALRSLFRVFEDLEKKLDRAHATKLEESIKLYASLINVKIFQVLPILGFILRSTNVRNTFELLEPFQVIAGDCLEGLPQVIISAEWDYVPFAYPQNIEDLQSFVLIGMPASEVNNSLLTPLAGHELGHAVWRNRSIGGAVNTTLQLRCEDLYQSEMSEFKKLFPEYRADDLHRKEVLPEAIETSLNYANSQAEEIFCDMFAYALFGESYLYAFAYVLAPGNGRGPTPKYPTYATRIGTLESIAKTEGVVLPSLGMLGLSDDKHRGRPNDRFIIRMAERSVEHILPGLWSKVMEIIAKKKVCRPTASSAVKHLSEMRLGTPAHTPRCLGDITNAGWMHYIQHRESAKTHPELIEKSANLNELILKTIEVMEFRRRTVGGT